RLEERARPFAGVRSEDGSVDEGEVAAVEEVAVRPHDGVPHAQDRVLPPAPVPQMPMVHQEISDVFLGTDGIVGGRSNLAELRHGELEHPSVLGMSRHHAADTQGSLLGQSASRFERVWCVVFADHTLNDPRAIADLQKLELLATAFVVQPPLELDAFSDMVREPCDVHASHPCGILQARAPMLASPITMLCPSLRKFGWIGSLLPALSLVTACGAVYPEVSTPVRSVPQGKQVEPEP